MSMKFSIGYYSSETMKLYIVATPIGNLQDITLRALEVLSKVKVVLSEDTRQTKKLLDKYGIKTRLVSYHQHSTQNKIDEICKLLKENKEMALVTDAGTPGVSDPGNKLIEKLLKIYGASIEILPIPGPSAITALASVAGIPMDKFCFMGFPPRKKKRKKFFEEIIGITRSANKPQKIGIRMPVILYESPHRILKTLGEIEALAPDIYTIVGKELTKLHEKIYRGPIKDVISEIKRDEARGEYTVIIADYTG